MFQRNGDCGLHVLTLIVYVADYSIMLHQQQGYYWQFEKTMKLRTGTENGETVGVPAEDGDNSAAMDLDADEADAAPPPPKEIVAMEAAAV